MSDPSQPEFWDRDGHLTFGGVTFDKDKDGMRLTRQLDDVRDHMLDEFKWQTLAEIHETLGYPEASISARLRDLRKARFGGYQVMRRRRKPSAGTWEYFVSRL